MGVSLENSSGPIAGLRKSAPIMLDLARRHCTPDCLDFHGIWQFTRLFGLLPSVARDKDFLADAVRQTVARGGRRILIAGAADDGILSSLVPGLDGQAAGVRFTLVDKCRAPLELNRLYADAQGLDLVTHQGDLRAFDDGAFDLILAHNLLGHLDAGGKAVLVGRWARLLAPDGRLALVERIKATAEPGARRFDQDVEADLLVEGLRKRRQSPDSDLMDEVLFAEMFLAFMRNTKMFFITSSDEIRGILESNNFECVEFERYSRTGEIQEKMPVTYTARIIAEQKTICEAQ